MHKALLRAYHALFVASLFLPVARSATMNASRATWGWEIVASFPLAIVNPLSLIMHPLIWAYVTALFACNLVVLCFPQLRAWAVRGTLPAGTAPALVLSVACAASVMTGVPKLLGVEIERLLIGYYCWLLSIIVAIAALVSPEGGRRAT
jgi:hypothetical protein